MLDCFVWLLNKRNKKTMLIKAFFSFNLIDFFQIDFFSTRFHPGWQKKNQMKIHFNKMTKMAIKRMFVVVVEIKNHNNNNNDDNNNKSKKETPFSIENLMECFIFVNIFSMLFTNNKNLIKWMKFTGLNCQQQQQQQQWKTINNNRNPLTRMNIMGKNHQFESSWIMNEWKTESKKITILSPNDDYDDHHEWIKGIVISHTEKNGKNSFWLNRFLLAKMKQSFVKVKGKVRQFCFARWINDPVMIIIIIWMWHPSKIVMLIIKWTSLLLFCWNHYFFFFSVTNGFPIKRAQKFLKVKRTTTETKQKNFHENFQNDNNDSRIYVFNGNDEERIFIWNTHTIH